eukprot:TRINITY_DN20313_c0_g1_i1.p1 TRINITY_DN20313_c0_g1~~TRINITY_DN20313_c0_g1_i1.p1  ORF type:complete len:528 (-),score=86.16 TRINITY_DN20313_c0_g1_i1:165-1748(-)
MDSRRVPLVGSGSDGNSGFVAIFKRRISENVFPRSLKLHDQKFKWVAIKWGLPLLINGFCLFLCSWMLHLATYHYVHEMVYFSAHFEMRDHPLAVKNTDAFESTANITDVALDDIAFVTLGYANISITVLDLFASAFPMLFMLLVVALDDHRTYTKALLCNSFLALIKGAIGAMTIIPDARGWEQCQAGLGEFGTAWFQETHSPFELLWHELVGADGKRLRWCADMMFSGHTYMVTLYALCLYEVLRVALHKWNIGKTTSWLILSLYIMFAVVQQTLEIVLILLKHFHYSMDVFVALLFTFLFYTNGAVAAASKWWELWGTEDMAEVAKKDLKDCEDFEKNLCDAKKELLKAAEEMNTEFEHFGYIIGDINTGIPEEIRTTQVAGYEALKAKRNKWNELWEQLNGGMKKDEIDMAKRMQVFGGDVLIPPCCCPFICCSGRQHVFEDRDILGLLNTMDITEEEKKLTQMRMQVGEGTTFNALTHFEMFTGDKHVTLQKFGRGLKKFGRGLHWFRTGWPAPDKASENKV